MELLDYATAVKLAEAAVAEKGPDFIYADESGVTANFIRRDAECSNKHATEDGGWVPGCLVGNMLHRHGVPLDKMPKHGDAFSTLRELNYFGIGIRTTEKAEIFMMAAQSSQDNGYTWGEAISAACEHVEANNYSDVI